MTTRLAADIGGTFTDLVFMDEKGSLSVEKTPSTPDEFRRGVMTGVEKILATVNDGDRDKVDLKDVEYFVHGATVVLNAVIQRKLPVTALVTTSGFRDVLEIMRTNNPHMYDMHYVKPKPLIPRRLRFEVAERVRHTGEVLAPLNEDDVRSVAKELREAGVVAVAICFLHSYANPEHERRAREILAEECPELVVCLSSEVAGEVREFERGSTTSMNAATMPIIRSYLDRLNADLRDLGLPRELYVMQSNGGVIRASSAQTLPVRTMLSGPSGGVVGGAYLANQIGLQNVVTLDMGGTSTDIGVIADGRAMTVDESKIDEWPVLAPMIEILAIGAGGGSIAWLDSGGALRVGPQSAGAMPGPVCYGHGGDEATVSDACLVLGRLDPDYFLGGEMSLDVDGAFRVIEQKLAKPMGMSIHEAALGVVTVVTTNMARAMRSTLIARGLDPRDFCLMAFGGAGGMVVGDLLKAGDINRAVVPNDPGALCAFGMLVTDFRHDLGATMVRPLSDVDGEEVVRLFTKLESDAVGRLENDGVERSRITAERFIDVRYIGQEHYLKIPVGESAVDFERLRNDFNAAHERIYGYATPQFPCELVNLRVTALGKVERPTIPRYSPRSSDDGPLAPIGSRQVHYQTGVLETDIYKIESIRAGDRFDRPAVIEDPRSTFVVLPGQVARVDEYRNVHVEEVAA